MRKGVDGEAYRWLLIVQPLACVCAHVGDVRGICVMGEMSLGRSAETTGAAASSVERHKQGRGVVVGTS